MTTNDARNVILDALIASGWRLGLDGPSGQYLSRGGDVIWVAWPFPEPPGSLRPGEMNFKVAGLES